MAERRERADDPAASCTSSGKVLSIDDILGRNFQEKVLQNTHSAPNDKDIAKPAGRSHENDIFERDLASESRESSPVGTTRSSSADPAPTIFAPQPVVPGYALAGNHHNYGHVSYMDMITQGAWAAFSQNVLNRHIFGLNGKRVQFRELK